MFKIKRTPRISRIFLVGLKAPAIDKAK